MSRVRDCTIYRVVNRMKVLEKDIEREEKRLHLVLTPAKRRKVTETACSMKREYSGLKLNKLLQVKRERLNRNCFTHGVMGRIQEKGALRELGRKHLRSRGRTSINFAPESFIVQSNSMGDGAKKLQKSSSFNWMRAQRLKEISRGGRDYNILSGVAYHN